MAHDRIPIDRLTWARWRRAVYAFVASQEVGGRAKVLMAVLLGLLLAISGLNVVNSYVGRDFMTAIEQRDMPRFVAMAATYIGVFVASTVAAVVYRFTEERLALLWRDWLMRVFLDLYLRTGNYYWLRDDGVANPDQRIADDVRVFTASTVSLALIVLNTTFTIVAFSGVMWSISPLLFAVAVGYAALGSVFTVRFGRPLIWLNYNQADREASLRADLVHLRENAESVAMLHREDRLGARLLHRVRDVVDNTNRIIQVNRNLGYFTTGYNYLIQIIPALIVAPLFIRGQAEFGVITQSAMAFTHLLGAFSLVITQFTQISGYAVVVARLSALAESVDRIEQQPGTGDIRVDDSGSKLAWQELSLQVRGDGEVLLQSLSLSLPPGTHLLVTGPNEAARIALFRASAGLWRSGQGRIVRPGTRSVLFVPERPYLPPGTLREALVPTGHEQVLDEASIVAALRAVGLEDVVERAGGLDVERDWDDVLSLADQQRVQFAHVLLAAPRFAVLDAPATLLGTSAAARVLGLLARRSITVVTFAADDALADHHDLRLVLEEHGAWRVQPVRKEVQPA